MTEEADGKAEEVVTPEPPQNIKRHNAVSIVTPIKQFRTSQTRQRKGGIRPAEGKQALKNLVFILANANADSSLSNVKEINNALNMYMEEHPEKKSKITTLPYLQFISDYAVDIAYPDNPQEQYAFTETYTEDLLSEKEIAIEDDKFMQFSLIEPMPAKSQKEIKKKIIESFIGIHGRLYQNTTRVIDAFENSLSNESDTTRRALFLPSSSPTKAIETPSLKLKPRKLSTREKLKAKWKKLPRGWKIFAGIVITLCSLCIIAAGILCPASLIITIPVAGKVAAKTLIMGSAGSIVAATVAIHSTHIAITKVEANANDEEQTTAQATSTDNNKSNNVGKSEEPATEQLPNEDQQAISYAIQSTVRGLLIAEAKGIAEEVQQLKKDEASAASPNTSPKTSKASIRREQALNASSNVAPRAALFANPATDDALYPMREEKTPKAFPEDQHPKTTAPASPLNSA